ncbi:hypothetical protein GCM10027451_23730 [Geodermatophilus aquaeductus]|jgi:hypothetical protein|uniref:Uncharacterized protein n=1 Tax=Geodermatophilus aquaeductus TaxID=1564161 RepID=A0A521AEG0_9ACTN|nr:hypothetical protein [Geodermatophilus aquaeductus]SMO33181.1 hypothetical protein SAMN06273567_10160 [Geodermatophilus aquaeductus]
MSVRTRSALPVLVGALVVLAPSAALADPPAQDPRTVSCGALLAQVQHWPGTGHRDQPIFSDGYELSLLSQPECTGTLP